MACLSFSIKLLEINVYVCEAYKTTHTHTHNLYYVHLHWHHSTLFQINVFSPYSCILFYFLYVINIMFISNQLHRIIASSFSPLLPKSDWLKRLVTRGKFRDVTKLKRKIYVFWKNVSIQICRSLCSKQFYMPPARKLVFTLQLRVA